MNKVLLAVVLLFAVLSTASAAPRPKVINGCVIAPGTQCPGVNLDGADLRGDDLSGSNLSYASAVGTKFDRADLRNANLYGMAGQTAESLHYVKALLCNTLAPDGGTWSYVSDCNHH